MATQELVWSAQKRLEFIEFRCFWEGQVNRADLIETFGISVPQATKDLSRYQELAPGNIHYDRRAKTYLASEVFNPVFGELNAEGYLSALADKIRAPSEASLLSEVPATQLTPRPFRSVDAQTLKAMSVAIRGQYKVQINYQSMSSPQTKLRIIHPHAFASDGWRWHVRAHGAKRVISLRILYCRVSFKRVSVKKVRLTPRATVNGMKIPISLSGHTLTYLPINGKSFRWSME